MLGGRLSRLAATAEWAGKTHASTGRPLSARENGVREAVPLFPTASVRAMRHSDSRATTAMNRVRGLGSRFVHFAAVSVVGREGSPTEGGARNVQSSAPPFHTV